MGNLLVIDARHSNLLVKSELVADEEAAKTLGSAAVTGRVWYTEQQLGEHILERLTQAGFVILRVMK